MTDVLVFTGPTMSKDEVLTILPGAHVRPPLRRGELQETIESHPCTKVLVLDGVFSGASSPPVSEFVAAARAGISVVGASSLGAVRAAECWPAGMQGKGLIYRMYRCGWLLTDAEVAVRVDPDRGYQAVTVALVDVRAHMNALVRRRLVQKSDAQRILEVVEQIHFLDRSVDEIRRALSAFPLQDQLWAADELHRGLKHRDAIRSLHEMAAPAIDTAPSAYRDVEAKVHRYSQSSITRPLNSAELVPFAEWILGLGLHQKHLWPILSRAALMDGVQTAGAPQTAATDLRSYAKQVLRGLLIDFPRFAELLVDEMAYADDLDSEVILWRSHIELLSTAKAASSTAATRYVEEEVAVHHGFRDWSDLLSNVHQDQVYGAIPFSLITAAVTHRARAVSLAWSAGDAY